MEATGVAVTVLGEITSDHLGAVLAHEHLICDFSIRGGNPDNRIQDWQLIARELELFRRAGGNTIFEVTPYGLGSNPDSLRHISEATGINIVRGIGFYHTDTYPQWVRSAGPDKIADFFVRHIMEGHNGIRAGLLGELASHNDENSDAARYRLWEDEVPVFRAAAIAQRQTGVAISTHASLGRAGHAQLKVLESAGADLSRVIIGHCDAYSVGNEEADLNYYLPILIRGSYVQFDLIGWNGEWPGIMTDELRARRLATLVRLGHGRQLLISTDTCRLSQLRAHGGRGYDYIWRDFLPQLRAQGVTDSEIDDILVNNPRQVASISGT